MSPKKALAASSVGTDAAEESVGVAVAESVGAAAANERRHIAIQSMQRRFFERLLPTVCTVLFRSYDGLEKERKKISIRKIEIARSEDRASSVPRSLSGPAPPCPPRFLIALHHFLAAAGCLPSVLRHGRRDRVSEGGVRPSGTPQVALWSARRMQIAPKLPLRLHSPSPPVRQVLGTNDEFAV